MNTCSTSLKAIRLKTSPGFAREEGTSLAKVWETLKLLSFPFSMIHLNGVLLLKKSHPSCQFIGDIHTLTTGPDTLSLCPDPTDPSGAGLSFRFSLNAVIL